MNTPLHNQQNIMNGRCTYPGEIPLTVGCAPRTMVHEMHPTKPISNLRFLGRERMSSLITSSSASGRGLRQRVLPSQQRGVVLLIALIILVAMTLAGIGMMRSVDTGNMIAGNLAFRQATLQAGDAGTSQAYSELVRRASSSNASDKTLLNCSHSTTQVCTAIVGVPTPALGAGNMNNFPGYVSIPLNPCEVSGACTAAQNAWWTTEANWNGAPTLTVTDPANNSTIATVQYLVHRMCLLANVEQSSTPLTTPSGTQLCLSERIDPSNPLSETLYIFRITSRSFGPRNTVTYSQQIARIDMQ